MKINCDELLKELRANRTYETNLKDVELFMLAADFIEQQQEKIEELQKDVKRNKFMFDCARNVAIKRAKKI